MKKKESKVVGIIIMVAIALVFLLLFLVFGIRYDTPEDKFCNGIGMRLTDYERGYEKVGNTWATKHIECNGTIYRVGAESICSKSDKWGNCLSHQPKYFDCSVGLYGDKVSGYNPVYYPGC